MGAWLQPGTLLCALAPLPVTTSGRHCLCASRSPTWLTPVPELLRITVKPDVSQAERRTWLKEGTRQYRPRKVGARPARNRRVSTGQGRPQHGSHWETGPGKAQDTQGNPGLWTGVSVTMCHTEGRLPVTARFCMMTKE